MGILFQESCLKVPDAKFKAISPGKITKWKRKKLVKRRRRQFDAIAEEARAWMYALLIPTDIIANGDVDIKKELDQQIAFLTTTILGSKIDHKKVNIVCGRIARNILIPGTANLDTGHEYYPPAPPFEDVKHLLDARFIKAGFLQHIYDFCPGFFQQHPHVRTWHEVQQVAGTYTLNGEPLQDVLERWQKHMTWAELGVPYYVDWRVAAEKEIYARIQSPTKEELTYYREAQRDLILARGDDGSDPYWRQVYADLDTETNIMTIHPLFYEQGPDSLQEILMRPGYDYIHNIYTRVNTLLHEITHSRDILDTNDHFFEYVPWTIDNIAKCFLQPVVGYLDRYTAYGLEPCLALVRRDNLKNTNKAEDNADSWAYYFTLRILLLVYPDLDIAGALHTRNPMRIQDREIWRRGPLLHHCSLLFPLRHWNADDLGNILREWHSDDLGDPAGKYSYDASKDYWSVDSGRRRPRTVKDILEIAQALDVEMQERAANQGDTN